MIYIYGKEKYLIDQQLKKVKLDFNGEILLLHDQISDEKLLNSIFSIPIFTTEIMVIIKDHKIFSDDDVAKNLITKLQHQNITSPQLVFVSQDMTKSNKNAFNQFLQKKPSVIKHYFPIMKEKEIFEFVKLFLKEQQIKILAFDLKVFLSKMPSDLTIIINELQKLMIESHDLKSEKINNSLFDFNQEDFFGFSNAILEKDKVNIFLKYDQKQKNNIPISLMVHEIAKLLWETYLLLLLDNNYHYSNEAMSAKTKIHSFRIRKLLKWGKSFSLKDLKKILDELFWVDRNIKSGVLNDKIAFETFLINLLK